eukprot:683142-Rhodomonas_salina.20
MRHTQSKRTRAILPGAHAVRQLRHARRHEARGAARLVKGRPRHRRWHAALTPPMSGAALYCPSPAPSDGSTEQLWKGHVRVHGRRAEGPTDRVEHRGSLRGGHERHHLRAGLRSGGRSWVEVPRGRHGTVATPRRDEARDIPGHL